MATEERWKSSASKQHSGAEQQAGGKESCVLLSQQLGEAERFTYAALCGISLAWLFPEKEQSSFRTEFIEALVKWLDLPDAVLPTMTAFASGLGGEGTETFAQLLLKDPTVKDNPVVITQVSSDIPLVSIYRKRSAILACLSSSVCTDREVNQNPDMHFLLTAEVSRKKKERRRKLKRYLLIGLATVGGGTVIGLTGGLAAPLVAAGAATIIGSAGAAALGSTAGIAVMASLFGAAGAGLTGYKMKKRVGAIEEFEFLPLTEGRQLHITIAITGWLCAGKYGSFTAPWSNMLHSREQYCLAWESKYLMELGSALDTLVNGFVNMMAQEALKFTVLSGIVTALTWPTSLLTVANVIDNPWGVCLHRSAEVGKHLAHILLSRQQGKRPVTLIGFSLGARVIYFCLQEMAQEKDSQGIIEDVVLLGAPVEGEAKYWKAITKVVSGRIINGYCRGDWLLGFVYRTSSVQLNVAGLQPVKLDDRRMVNMDLSSVVSGHLDYMKQMDVILKAVGIKTKECRQEEKGSVSLFSPLAKKSQQAAGSETQEEENTVQEEDGADSDCQAPTASTSVSCALTQPVSAGTSSDGDLHPGDDSLASCAHQEDSPGSLLAESSPPCPACPSSVKQAAGDSTD
uniref:Transmembrane and coiled-coil domains 4 n=1 Tax=Coturnix japonica TaxID=93934 RepID=A0A8C2U968_COTJA